MVIIGAKGLAKEVLEIFVLRAQLDELYFFDDLSADLPSMLFDRFKILRSHAEVGEVFRSHDSSFTLGLGNPELRFKMAKLFKSLGGRLTSAISPQAAIGSFGNRIGEGCTILPQAVITNGVTIGEGCLINPHASISHDAVIGDFVEISPGARVTGHSKIDSFSRLGTNAVILPKIRVGINVTVGAGTVVVKDTSDNVVVVGAPARQIKQIPPIKP
jgi:sugar O-acyltransferase (sialic acid O-acetyltransferase NeuD family)